MKEEIIIRWLNKANNDLKAVQHLLTLGNNAPTDVIAFHSQQAVEKYLKAYLTLLDIRSGKIHDIEALLNLCIVNDKEFEKLDKTKISDLTFYAVEIRYPEEHIDVTLDEARELYEIAEGVKKFILKKLKEKGIEWQV